MPVRIRGGSVEQGSARAYLGRALGRRRGVFDGPELQECLGAQDSTCTLSRLGGAMDLETIRELFRYNDWGRDRLMSLVVELNRGQLDRPFEMGEGSLSKTVWHLFKWEWTWLKRWKGRWPTEDEVPRDFPAMQDLWDQWRRTASERNLFLETLTDQDLRRRVTYTNPRGEVNTFCLGHILLHVCTHGTHHRAQAVNMLRQLGVQPPQMDFLCRYEERSR